MEQLYKIPYLPGTFFNRQLNKRKSSPHWLVSQQTVRVTLALAQVFAEARLLQQNFHIWLVVLCALSTFLTLSTLLNFDSLDLPLLLIEKRPLWYAKLWRLFCKHPLWMPVLNSLKLFFLNYLLVRNLTFLSREKDKCQAKAAKKRRARCKMVEKL